MLSKLSRIKRAGLFSIPAFSFGYLYDKHLNERCFQRNLRALWTGCILLYNYKIRWEAHTADEVHQEVAEAILQCCQLNGGLYIKFGQGVASMNHILPKQYNETFSILHDKALSVEFDYVEEVFLEEFGKTPDDMFQEFERQPIASASIAQVHRAVTKEGLPVAVKVQKPAIQRQFNWDMFCYRIILTVIEQAFELPLMWSYEYTVRQMEKEVDFRVEKENSRKAQAELSKSSSLKDVVIIPHVFDHLSSRRVMTAEWIDGVKINEAKSLGLDLSKIHSTAVSIFGFQIFESGFVHCDPHPGNLLVQKSEVSPYFKLVLLDHGLYIEEPHDFREKYCDLWLSMFSMNIDRLTEICKSWGISDVDMFATATLIKPFTTKQGVKRNLTQKDIYDMHMNAKEKAKTLLYDSARLPQELVFVGRNMNIVRANNKDAGSVCNRINILANHAASGAWGHLGTWRILVFHMNRFLSSLTYELVQFWRRLNLVFGFEVGGFEDVLDQTLAKALYEQGIIVDPSAFDA